MTTRLAVHQCNIMTLRARRKSKRDPTATKILVSRAVKQQRLSALERVNDETYRVGPVRAVFSVVLVSDKRLYISIMR